MDLARSMEDLRELKSLLMKTMLEEGQEIEGMSVFPNHGNPYLQVLSAAPDKVDVPNEFCGVPVKVVYANRLINAIGDRFG